MRDPKTGRYQREGKWQIMIHGESYKPIVAEAARKAATEVYNRIMVTHLHNTARSWVLLLPPMSSFFQSCYSHTHSRKRAPGK